MLNIIGKNIVLFQDKTAALRYIASSAGQDKAVKYLDDDTLPSGWRCQRIQSSIYYFSPRGERYFDTNGREGRILMMVLTGLKQEMQLQTGWRRMEPVRRSSAKSGREGKSKELLARMNYYCMLNVLENV